MDKALSYNQQSKSPACWVYLIEQEDHSYSIRYSLDLYKELRAFPHNASLIFYRSFYNIVDGIAYKVLLENLSIESIFITISLINPNKENMCKKLLDEYKKRTIS